MRNSICMLSFLLRRIFLTKKYVFDLIGLGVCFFTKRVRILVKVFRDFNIFSLYIFKTSMSSVFTFQDFNVFSLYISRLQCLQSLHFKTSMSSVFYISRFQCLQSLDFKTSMSPILLCKMTTSFV